MKSKSQEAMKQLLNIKKDIPKGKKLETQKSHDQEEVIQPDSISLEPSYNHKPDPFYVSLFLHGFKLIKCIIDSGASDNIMPAAIAKALDLPLTKTFGKCYSMDSK